MEWVQVTGFFRVDSPDVFKQCDLLMEALVDGEDEHVFDAAISVDTSLGIVTVEVTACGADAADAASKASERVRRALTENVGVPVLEAEPARVEQLALA